MPPQGRPPAQRWVCASARRIRRDCGFLRSVILFTGGTIRNRANPAAAPLVIDNDVAADVAWSDYRDGLSDEERTWFARDDQQDARLQLALTQAGRDALARVQADPGSSGVHDHVRHLLRATASVTRTFHVMPISMFRELPADRAWLTGIATRNNPSRSAMVINLNGYGFFPVEWLGYEVAGRTHRATRRQVDDACVYVTRFPQFPLAPRAQASWNFRTNRSRQVGRMRGDTLGRWADREGTVTLYHELIHHAIRGEPGHAGQYDEWVERRARNNWNEHNPAP